MAFFDQTTIASGTVVSWEWDFGDGSLGSQAQDPAHIYAVDSVYEVSLTATSNLGCSVTFTDSVEVFSIPIVDFIAPATCRNDTVPFTDASQSTQGTINYWEWE
jgi:PKD repeat protein